MSFQMWSMIVVQYRYHIIERSKELPTKICNQVKEWDMYEWRKDSIQCHANLGFGHSQKM